MDRIMIIGLNGSGKSRLAHALGGLLNREVTHLDKLYYRLGWNAVSKEEWEEITKNLISKDQWIIDGSYPSSMDARMERANMIIWLNFNKIICLYRIFNRTRSKVQPFDRPEGDLHKFSWWLAWKIIKYPKNKILKKLEKYKGTKKILILKNDKQVANFLSNFGQMS